MVKFNNIRHVAKQRRKGTLNMSEDGFEWQALSSGSTVTVKGTDIKMARWTQKPGGMQLKVFLVEDKLTVFEGFKEDDLTEIKKSIEEWGGKVKRIQAGTNGWNWGEVSCQGPDLNFTVLEDGKPQNVFEFPLAAISQSHENKNEVSLELHVDDTGNEAIHLVNVRFYCEDPPAFNQEIIKKADIGDNVEAVASFDLLNFVIPRGRFALDFYPKFLRMHGKSFNYKILFTSINKMFLFERPDGIHRVFVLGLDPPIMKGRTSHPYLILQFKNDHETDMVMKITEDEVREKFGASLNKEMVGPTFDIVTRMFKAFSKKKIVVPGKFLSYDGMAAALNCSLKASSGLLYVLEKSFFFVGKPPRYIRHDHITEISFDRLAGGSQRMFDMVVMTNRRSEFKFTSFARDEFTGLLNFLTAKDLPIADLDTMKKYASQGRATKVVDYSDPYLKQLEGEAGDSSEDEDYETPDSSSSDDEDYDEVGVAGVDGDSPEDEGSSEEEMVEHQSSKKRKRGSDGQNDSKVTSAKPKPKPKKKGPKRALSGYQYYGKDKEVRKLVTDANPDATVQEIVKKIAIQWKNLSDEDKTPYLEQAAEDKKRYAREKANMPSGSDMEIDTKIKKKKKKKGGPKRGRAAYAFFRVEFNLKIKAENPDMKFGEISKKAGAAWQAMSEADKVPYVELSNKDKARYKKEMAAYSPSESESSDDTKKKKKKKKNVKRPGEPKKALSAYFLFQADIRQKVKDENPGLANKDVVKEIGARWQKITEEEKEAYKALAIKDKKRYADELEVFEAKLKEKAMELSSDEEKARADVNTEQDFFDDSD